MENQEHKRQRCEVWTRVMGYHRPVSHFNIGKKAEHFNRKHFQECIAQNSKFKKEFEVAHAQKEAVAAV